MSSSPAPGNQSCPESGRAGSNTAATARKVELPVLPAGHELILHFQAVHYRAEVQVDGASRGTHVGGQLPFDVDLSGDAGRIVELSVLVEAPTDKADIPHGKQRSIPEDPYDVCSFTPCSGIWQSVWLEQRPVTYLRVVRFTSAASLDRFHVVADVAGAPDGCRIILHTDGPDSPDGPHRSGGEGDTAELRPGQPGELPITDPHLWSPASPWLYPVTVQLWRDETLLDTVTCTTGLRTVTVDGTNLLLNGERIFLRGVLDQGFWPTSGWTAPSLEALQADLLAARAAGFNLVRKHLKLEDPRWLHLADRTGMLVWEEPPSTSRFTEDAVRSFQDQLAPMVERDGNHPSIVIWGLYNEEWGLDWDVASDPAKSAALEQAYKEITSLDASRPVIDNSGWSHVRTDLLDWHIYAPDQISWRAALDELATGFDVDLGAGGRRHKQLFADGSPPLGCAMMNSEYGTGTTSVERAWIMRWQTQELRRHDDNNGYVYCELYDIEHETAGVLTFDRRPKDTLGLVAVDSHADTVIVLDVLPVAPGTDLYTSDGNIRVEARISFHAGARQQFRLRTGWGQLTSSSATADHAYPAVEVEPYILSSPVIIEETLPVGAAAGRLHLWVEPEHGQTPIAHTVLDVRHRQPG